MKSGCASSWLKCNRFKVAEPTGLEPATSDVTGRRSNQLNYDSACELFKSPTNFSLSNAKMVGTEGLEPPTSSL
jgi:hypothetical protein